MTRTPVPLGGRPRWQPILSAVFAPLSLLWAPAREYWRTWWHVTHGKVVAGCMAANAALQVIALGAIATLPDVDKNDPVGWYRDGVERIGFWSGGIVGNVSTALAVIGLGAAIYLGWKTADELGTPNRPALVNGAGQ